MTAYSPGQVPQDPKEFAAFLDLELQKLKDALAQPKFIVPTLLNSWANLELGYSPAGFYQDALGRVHLRGVLKDGTIPSDIFVLPAGYRPSSILIFPVLVFGTVIARVDIETDGSVRAMNGNNTWLSLDGISFAAV